MADTGPVIPLSSEVNNPGYLTGAGHVYDHCWQE